MMQQTQELLTRVQDIREVDRSVEVCWTTGASVKRYSREEGYYMEELQVDKKSIRLDRFNAMSLLDTHDNSTMDARLGTVVPGTVRIEGGKGYARIQFSRTPRGEALFQDILDGHPLPISVGYKVHRSEKTEAANGKLPVLRAVDWEPMELSAVPIPADPGAVSRSEEEENMPQNNVQQRNDDDHQQDDANRKMSVREARGFVHELVERMDLSADDRLELDGRIKRGMTEGQVRDALLDIVVARQNRSPTFPHADHSEHRHNGMTRAQAMTDALMVRVDPAHKPADTSREFVGMSLLELAKEALEGQGISARGMSKSEVAQRAFHGTSSFPIILGQAGQVVLQKAYAGEVSGLKSAAKPSTIDDFRLKTSVRTSDWPDLKKVNEHGEFPRGTITESKESYKLETYGRIIGFTRQLLINDSLGALIEPARQFGRSAAVLEAEILANLLLSNPKMSDGKTLFHADHKNLLEPFPLCNDALSEARKVIRRQTDEKGKPAGLRAKYLVVPPDLEAIAERILTPVASTRTIDVVDAGNLKLEIIVEDRLVDPRAWYLVADPDTVDGLEYAFLTGEPGPQFSERIGFDIDGVEYKCREDFGAGWMGWRGWYKNPGQ